MEFELNELQLSYLNKIKKKRSLFFLKAFGGLLLFPASFLIIELNENGLNSPGNIDGFFIILLIVMLLAGVPMLILYVKRIIPLLRDIKGREGIMLQLQIIRKQHFPLTNEYYIFLASTSIPNVKIDHVTFKHYKEGDYFSIGSSKHAKIVFEDYDRYEIV